MADRLKTKKCPACDRAFIKGRKALVSGKLRLVCLGCSANAIRVVTSITRAKCVSRHCNGTASVCQTCLAREIADATADPLAMPRAQLRATILAYTRTAPPDDKGHSDYMRGRIEGLLTGLALIGGEV